MGKRIARISVWIRRRSHFMFILVGVVVVLLLFFNEDTSIALSMQYQNEINDLKDEIRLNRDSAEYYRGKREAVLAGRNELEHLARERFNMQRPTEDVYIIR